MLFLIRLLEDSFIVTLKKFNSLLNNFSWNKHLLRICTWLKAMDNGHLWLVPGERNENVWIRQAFDEAAQNSDVLVQASY